MAEIEKAFGTKLAPAVLIQAPTLEQLAALLEERNPAPPSRVVALIERGAGPPLFLVTPFHGDALMFRELSRTLAPVQPVFALQPPPIVGTRCRETVEGAAAEMVESIIELQPNGPYYVAGYCIGGQIAFEVASQLRATGHRVAFLGLLDSVRADTVAAHAAGMRTKSGSAGFSKRARSLGAKVLNGRRSLEKVRGKARRFLLRTTFEFCRRTGMRQPRYLQDENELDGLIAARYRPRPYSGSAVLFRSDIVQRLLLPPGDGWAGLVESLEQVNVAGDHVAILHPPDVHNLGDKMTEALEAARREAARWSD